MRKRIADQLDEALRTGARGGSVPEVDELVDTAGVAQRLASETAPPIEREAQAYSRLRAALSEEKRRRASQHGRAVRVRPWALPGFSNFQWIRPGMVQAASALGAIVLFAGALLGASAAGADITQPLRTLFGAESEVKAVGIIIELGADTIIVRTDTGNVVVTITDNTQITNDEKELIALNSLAVGQAVEIKGALQPDDTIRAFRVRARE